MKVNGSFKHRLVLTAKEKADLADYIAKKKSVDFIEQNFTQEDLVDFSLSSQYLPDRLLRFLKQFRTEPNQQGAIIIRNLPIDTDLDTTPIKQNEMKIKRSFFSEWLLTLIMASIADIVAYKEEKLGKYIHNITPAPGREGMQENCGSVLLELHTEHGFHPFKQDYVSLICLRRDHDNQALTLAGSIYDVLKKLDSQTIEILQKRWYHVHVPESFGYQKTYFSPAMPVLSADLTYPTFCIDFDAMYPINEKAKQALATLRSVLENCLIGEVLQPGDLLLVDNNISAHARTAFNPRYDGKDRWLQRISGIRDIRHAKASLLHKTNICRPVLDEQGWCAKQSEKPLCKIA